MFNRPCFHVKYTISSLSFVDGTSRRNVKEDDRNWSRDSFASNKTNDPKLIEINERVRGTYRSY